MKLFNMGAVPGNNFIANSTSLSGVISIIPQEIHQKSSFTMGICSSI